MSSRRNRRRPEGRPGAGTGSGAGASERTEEWSDGTWVVRAVTGDGAGKPYRCPGCDQRIPPRLPHVVAWPAAGFGGLDDRRHWHSVCWRNRMRRGPKP